MPWNNVHQFWNVNCEWHQHCNRLSHSLHLPLQSHNQWDIQWPIKDSLHSTPEHWIEPSIYTSAGGWTGPQKKVELGSSPFSLLQQQWCKMQILTLAHMPVSAGCKDKHSTLDFAPDPTAVLGGVHALRLQDTKWSWQPGLLVLHQQWHLSFQQRGLYPGYEFPKQGPGVLSEFSEQTISACVPSPAMRSCGPYHSQWWQVVYTAWWFGTQKRDSDLVPSLRSVINIFSSGDCIWGDNFLSRGMVPWFQVSETTRACGPCLIWVAGGTVILRLQDTEWCQRPSKLLIPSKWNWSLQQGRQQTKCGFHLQEQCPDFRSQIKAHQWMPVTRDCRASNNTCGLASSHPAVTGGTRGLRLQEPQ